MGLYDDKQLQVLKSALPGSLAGGLRGHCGSQSFELGEPRYRESPRRTRYSTLRSTTWTTLRPSSRLQGRQVPTPRSYPTFRGSTLAWNASGWRRRRVACRRSAFGEEFAESGGLLSYAPLASETYRAHGNSDRQDSEGRQSGRFARGATDPIRARDQLEGSEGAWLVDSPLVRLVPTSSFNDRSRER